MSTSPNETTDPRTALERRLVSVYDVTPDTAADIVGRYFQVNPMPDDITDPRTLKEWLEAEAEDIYTNRRYWD